MRKNAHYLSLLVLVLGISACGTSNTGQKVADSTSVPPASATQVITQIYKIGDVIAVNDHQFTMTGATYSNGILRANFLVENKGTKDVNLSSLLSFSAKDDSGTKLDQALLDCGNSLDGKVVAGDKLRGDICYKLPTAGTVKIYYKNILFGSGAVIWQMDATKLPASLTDAPVTTTKDTPNPFADKIYAIGEVVVLQDQSIILNSATFSGDLLTANFSIANTSTTDMLISSLLNFSAKKSDGLRLEQTTEDCGGIGDMLDGGLFAGQKKRGIICYQTGGVTDITIYYVPDPYGLVSVAWEVKK